MLSPLIVVLDKCVPCSFTVSSYLEFLDTDGGPVPVTFIRVNDRDIW